MASDRNPNLLTEKQVAAIRKRLKPLVDIHGQAKVAADFGVSQSTVSNICDEEKQAHVTRGRAELMASNYGIPLDELLSGTLSAGKYEGLDMTHPGRGRALDILSAVYETDFLKAMLAQQPPPDSENWTPKKWVETIVDARKLWESGVLTLAGLKPFRRTASGK